jgi:hypothetical protein
MIQNADYLMVFRDTYTSGPARVTKLSPEELPEEYVTLARASA